MRWFLGGGLLLVGIGLLLMRGLAAERRLDGAAARLPLAGVGIGLVNPALATAAIGVVEPRRAGMASGINSTFRQVGIATGIAGLGALFQHKVASTFIEQARGRAAAARGRHGCRRLRRLRRRRAVDDPALLRVAESAFDAG